MLYRWKESSMLTNWFAACTHLSSTVSQLFEPQVQKIAVFTYRSPHFYRAMRSISAVFSVMQCPSVRPSLCPSIKHRITRKLLKIDRYMLRGVWQALNCLSIHATYCVIVEGHLQGKQKCGMLYVKTAIVNCCKLHNFITVVNYTIFAAIIDSFMSN